MRNYYPSFHSLFYPALPYNRMLLILVLCFLFCSASSTKLYSQGRNDIGTRACVQSVGNGLYQANFEYENPQRKEITLKPEQSKVKLNKQGKSLQGITRFKPGVHSRAFSVTFSKDEVVEWTIVNPSGQIKTVTASASSSHCQETDEGFIFPVYAENGKTPGLLDPSSFALATGNAGNQPAELIYQIREGSLLVEIIPKPDQMTSLLQLLETAFGLNNASGDFLIDPATILQENLNAADVFIPVSRLLELNNYPNIINFVRTLYPPITGSYDAYNGIVTSEGDLLQGSAEVRKSFGIVTNGSGKFVDGSGFSAGIMSDSFDKAPFTGEQSKADTDVLNGDLPGPSNPEGYLSAVEVLQENPGLFSTDEGRAMLQIFHDVAPGANLKFYSGTGSLRAFELGVKALADSGVDLIGDDITFINEDFDGDGPVAEEIASFLAQGDKYYVSSSGNFSNKAFMGNFKASSTNPINNFQLDPLERAHVFGTLNDGSEDYLLRFSVKPGTYMLVLQWDENFATSNISEGAVTDLDLYIVDDQGRLLVGNNTFSLDKDPTEITTFQATAEGQANIMIVSESGTGTQGLPFRVIAFRYNGLDFLEYAGAPTISGHAAAQGVIAVGATNATVEGMPQARSYSSYAGQISSGKILEVSISGPDGVSTNVDGFKPFAGTSAAAPHIMGAIALLKPALKAWYDNSNIQQGGIPEALTLYKENARPAGISAQAGAGFIDVLKTFSGLAAKAPLLNAVYPADESADIGGSPTQFILTGANFNESAKIIFNGETLVPDSIEPGKIVVTIPEFTGNPELYVSVTPLTPTGSEITDSNPLPVLDKQFAFRVVAQNAQIEYGQDYELSYQIEGLPEGVTYEDTGLPAIAIATTTAGGYPDVNTYLISVGFSTPPTEDQLKLYRVSFKSATLEVTKKELTIKPRPATFTYGDLVKLDIDYLYDATGIADNNSFLNYLQTAHQSAYYSENTFALVNRLRTVLNAQEILTLLNNNAWMASENIFQNRLRTVLNGMNVIDLETQHFDDYLNAYDPVTNRLRTVLNRLRTVMNGQDFFDGRVDVSIENRLRTVLNASEYGQEDDKGDYNKTFSIIDAEDLSTDTEERAVQKLYALNLITGLEVTANQESRHYTYPGVLLHPVASNFNILYDLDRLEMLPATLEATTGDLWIAQGETIDPALISYTLTGFKYGETESDVYPEGISFTFTDPSGNAYESGDTGYFLINISQPENYLINNRNPGVLYVNPSDGSKIRTYFDCVQLNPNQAADGYPFIANFRYINPNNQVIYVSGENNFITSTGRVGDQPPVAFLPGENYVRVRFDGNRMTWNLCTFGSCNPTSVSTDATLETNRCTAKQVESIEALSQKITTQAKQELQAKQVAADQTSSGFLAYPNPFRSELQLLSPGDNIILARIFDTSGNLILTYTPSAGEVGSKAATVPNLDYLAKGTYFLQITTTSQVKLFKLIKN